MAMLQRKDEIEPDWAKSKSKKVARRDLGELKESLWSDSEYGEPPLQAKDRTSGISSYVSVDDTHWPLGLQDDAPGRHRQNPTRDRFDDIDELYREIDELLERRAQDEAVEDKIQQKFDQLRALQEKEAQRMGKIFEQNLTMPLDAGQKAIEGVDELLKSYGHSPGED